MTSMPRFFLLPTCSYGSMQGVLPSPRIPFSLCHSTAAHSEYFPLLFGHRSDYTYVSSSVGFLTFFFRLLFHSRSHLLTPFILILHTRLKLCLVSQLSLSMTDTIVVQERIRWEAWRLAMETYTCSAWEIEEAKTRKGVGSILSLHFTLREWTSDVSAAQHTRRYVNPSGTGPKGLTELRRSKVYFKNNLSSSKCV